VPFPGTAAYSASKAGVLGLTNVLRAELRERGIRVVALVPGPIATDLWEQFWPDAPREKMVMPATVAEVVAGIVRLPAEATVEEVAIGPTGGTL
jgi:3-oxoacyl-[acyl-carrier protein] reductase